MASFEAQVEALTGLAIESSGSNPTQTQLEQYLNDGVIDVTNRCLLANPGEKDNFTRSSTEQTSNGFNPGSDNIISVVRENGTDNQWMPCTKQNIALEYKVTDKDSLYYASAFNPVYMITQNRNVHVYPEPSAGGANSFKVLYVNYSPQDSDGGVVDIASTGLKWFPQNKEYLVLIYAAIKSLETALAAKNIPTVAGSSEELTGTITSGTIGTDADFADFSDWFETLGHMVEDEEDLEMAQVQIQKIATYLNTWQTQLQGNTTDYNWMQGRHQLLSRQYDTAFVLMKPPQPQEGGR